MSPAFGWRRNCCAASAVMCARSCGGLQAAKLLGRNFDRLVMLSSLSKRSNVPGMRSGFVAGDAEILKSFLLYRTYHGNAMSPTIQAASIAALAIRVMAAQCFMAA